MPTPAVKPDSTTVRGPSVPPYVERIAPYVPGKPVEELEREIPLARSAKLASNENPWGPSPKALEAVRQALAGAHRYPDGSAFYLRRALAERHGVSMDEVIVGNGSTDLIEICARTYLADGEAGIAGEQAFLMFRLGVESVNGRLVPVKMPGWKHDLLAMAEAARREKAKLVYLPNPNNPTGTWNSRTELDAYFDAVPDGVLTLLDEAYIDYVVEKEYPDGLDDFRKGRNVLVLRTFSKIYGLAGIRIGYGIAKTSVLAEMNKIRSPFNTSSIAQAAALGALADDEYRALSRGRNLEEMRFLEAGLRARGVDFTPSAGNFVLVHTDLPGGVWYQALLRQGVIVRPVGAYSLPNAFRVSVGNREENELFFSAWDAVAAAGGPPRG